MSDYLVSLARRAHFGPRFAAHKLAMIALCNAASDAGEGVDMPAKEIAESADLADVKSAMKVRAALVAAGLLHVIESGGRGQGVRGEYRIAVARLTSLFEGAWSYADEVARHKAGRDAARAGRREARVVSEHPSADGGVASDHPSDELRVAPSDHPTNHPNGDALGGPLGVPLGGPLGGLTPQSPLKKDNYLSPSLTLPLPGSVSECEGEVQRLLEQVLAASPLRERAIAMLLGPLVRQRTFTAPDRVYALGAVADRAYGLPPRVLDDALSRIKARRKATVKPSDIEDALAEAEAAHKAALKSQASREADERQRAEEVAQARVKAERLAADTAENQSIGAALARRADGAQIIEAFARSLASPIERSAFRRHDLSTPNWLSPLVREQAAVFLARHGIAVSPSGEKARAA